MGAEHHTQRDKQTDGKERPGSDQEDAAGGNKGSKGQNVDSRRSSGTGKERGDIGDTRGRSRGVE